MSAAIGPSRIFGFASHRSALGGKADTIDRLEYLIATNGASFELRLRSRALIRDTWLRFDGPARESHRRTCWLQSDVTTTVVAIKFGTHVLNLSPSGHREFREPPSDQCHERNRAFSCCR